MKILITGSSGLVGRNVLESSRSASYELLTPKHSELNLLNRSAVENYLRREKPDCIIHIAAKVGSVELNLKHPLNFLLENLDMGRNLIIGAYELGIENFINISSACIYPANMGDEIFSEAMVFQGAFERENEGYASAKSICAQFCKYIRQENPLLNYKTLVPCNMYGRFDNFDSKRAHMIPAAIQKILHAKETNSPTVQIWGNGKARRELMYAGDFAEFVWFAVENLNSLPDILNVGTGEDFTVDECYKTIAEVLNYNGKFIHDETKPTGMKRRLLNVELMRSLGWSPKTSLADGIAKTVNFYKAHRSE